VSRKGPARPRFVVVSGYGNEPMTPRGQRTRWIVEALSEHGDVELVAMPERRSPAQPGGSSPRRARLRKAAASLAFRVMLDRWEPWAFKHLRDWRPVADAALIIASPWSPAVYASRRLVKGGIPYVLDVGDPWIMTSDLKPPTPPWAIRGEKALWANARGAVVTTEAQAADWRRIYPGLPLLIRPNGFKPLETAPPPRVPGDPSVLRLAHFGILSAGRVDPVPLLTDLWRSGRWRAIEFSQFGYDYGVGLGRVPDGVKVVHHDPLPWGSVAQLCGGFDALLAIAYPTPKLLPSKAIEYSTLPLPRIALTNAAPADALRLYSAEHAGWLAVSNGEPELAARIEAHVSRPWTEAELAPDPDDAWPAVSALIVKFLEEVTSIQRPATTGRA
jgi:hypothetical protein